MKELSTGNRKKAFLITAFALKPELLLLDEPVNGLDFQSTEYLYRLIRSYKAYGTVLFASHILESITLTSDRVLVLEHGRIGRTFEKEQIDADEIREALRDEDDVCELCQGAAWNPVRAGVSGDGSVRAAVLGISFCRVSDKDRIRGFVYHEHALRGGRHVEDSFFRRKCRTSGRPADVALSQTKADICLCRSLRDLYAVYRGHASDGGACGSGGAGTRRVGAVLALRGKRNRYGGGSLAVQKT